MGKKPKKLEIELADLEDIEASVTEAKKEHSKAESKEKAQASEEKEDAKDPMELLNNKQLNSLTFDNGAMISSLAEIKDMLPTLDEDIFKLHVNEEKNEISDWLKELSPSLATKLKPAINKADMIKILEAFDGKSSPSKPKASTKSTTKKKSPSKK